MFEHFSSIITPIVAVLRWDADINVLGILGTNIEIKRVGEQEFTLETIRNRIGGALGNLHQLSLSPLDLRLNQGISILRISYIGGPFWHQGEIRISLDSEPVYITLEVDMDGNIAVLSIE